MSEASLDDVDRVYSEDMLGVRGQVYLEHYQSRLRMVLGDDGYEDALELLTEAAVSDGHLTDDSIRRYETYRSVLSPETAVRITGVLHVLEHDGYLDPPRRWLPLRVGAGGGLVASAERQRFCSLQ